MHMHFQVLVLCQSGQIRIFANRGKSGYLPIGVKQDQWPFGITDWIRFLTRYKISCSVWARFFYGSQESCSGPWPSHLTLNSIVKNKGDFFIDSILEYRGDRQLHRGASLAIAPVFKDWVYKELSFVLNRYVLWISSFWIMGIKTDHLLWLSRLTISALSSIYLHLIPSG